MARMARAVAPGFPHHITQRGNRRQQTFQSDQDFEAYLTLMSEWCLKYKLKIWAYCLMPNHIHLIAVPETKDGLNPAIGEAHRRYTRMIDFREGWRGHLWQGRFASFIMEERYLLACTQYIEYNPVRSGLAKCPEDWNWSSARPHMDEGPRPKINPPSCLSFCPSTALHPPAHIHKYALADAPCQILLKRANQNTAHYGVSIFFRNPDRTSAV